MVSTFSIIAIATTLIVSTLLPLIFAIIWCAKNKGKKTLSALLLGALGFFVMQIVIRTPILYILSQNKNFTDFANNHYTLYCLILAFTAALFEVVARYGVAKILRKDLSFERSFAAGLGHGGIESIIIIGMTYISNLVLSFMINTNTFDIVVEQTSAQGIDASNLTAVKEQLLNTNPSTFLLGGFERILTITIHIGLTVLIWYFVKHKKDIIGILICLLAHFAFDFVGGFVQGLATGYLGNVLSTTTAYIIIYSFLTAVAITSVVFIVKIRKKWNIK